MKRNLCHTLVKPHIQPLLHTLGGTTFLAPPPCIPGGDQLPRLLLYTQRGAQTWMTPRQCSKARANSFQRNHYGIKPCLPIMQSSSKIPVFCSSCLLADLSLSFSLSLLGPPSYTFSEKPKERQKSRKCLRKGGFIRLEQIMPWPKGKEWQAEWDPKCKRHEQNEEAVDPRKGDTQGQQRNSDR